MLRCRLGESVQWCLQTFTILQQESTQLARSGARVVGLRGETDQYS